MTRTHHIIMLTIASLLWCSSAFGEKLKYDVLLFGKKIGETVVELKDSAGIKRYTLRSNTQVKMLFMDKKSAMSTDVLFGKDGIMNYSFFKNVKEDGTMLTNAIYQNGKVLIEKNGEKSTISNPVKFSSVLMYFSEPINLQKVFSERLGTFFEIIKQSEGKYYAEINGSSAVYTYVHGKLTELEMKSTLGSVFLKLVN
jgi:hypothetical protein